MNEDLLRNTFQCGLTNLVRDALEFVSEEGRDPFAGEGVHNPHEHDTRSLFIDRLLTLLGWRLGPHGNVLEEVRIKGETTRFMDYVGVSEQTQAPMLIVEAKAWDKPYITARVQGVRATDRDLLVAAIRHLLDGKNARKSPVTKIWHDYLDQISCYVKTMKLDSGHNTPRAVLVSGPWLVVFTEPVTTFVDGVVSSEQIVIFRIEEYENRANELFNLLHRSVLARDVPFPLRPAELPQYLDLNSLAAAFHGLHVHYEETGSRFYGPRPQVLVYPTLILERDDGILITIVARQDGYPLSYTKIGAEDDEGEDQFTLDAHLAEVQAGAVEVLAACEGELGGAIAVAPLARFPGFSFGPSGSPQTEVRMVKPIKGHCDEWLVVTGPAPHYLYATPLHHSCRFHAWAACHVAGYSMGNYALSLRSIDPRAIFVDTQAHHCAHQLVQDRRMQRCHIMAIDQRTCCQACIFVGVCWKAGELTNLPCGR